MTEIKFPVIKVSQPIGDYFIASIDAKELVEISYSDVRRLASAERDVERYLGIQRPVSKKRITEIKKYITGGDATFPTSVIIAVDEKCAEFEENQDGKTGFLILKHYPGDDDELSIPFDKIAKVIDGQHRIAAFMDEGKNWSFDCEDRKFHINVSIFVGADIAEQANIFATVNLAQTKVNKSLVYDLTELAKTPSPHKTCHNIAVILDGEETSPLYHRIKRLGTATPNRKKEPLTQAVFVEALVPFVSRFPEDDRIKLLDGINLSKLDTSPDCKETPFRRLFIEDREIDIAEILYNYFSAIKDKWPDSWGDLEKTGNLLPKSNAFKALMKYLKEDILPRFNERDLEEIPSVDDFKKFFDGVKLSDKDFNARNLSPGSSGQSAFLKLLRGELKIDDLKIE